MARLSSEQGIFIGLGVVCFIVAGLLLYCYKRSVALTDEDIGATMQDGAADGTSFPSNATGSGFERAATQIPPSSEQSNTSLLRSMHSAIYFSNASEQDHETGGLQESYSAQLYAKY